MQTRLLGPITDPSHRRQGIKWPDLIDPAVQDVSRSTATMRSARAFNVVQAPTTSMMDWRCSEDRPDTMVNIGEHVGFAGFQIQGDQLSVPDRDVIGEIEAIEHAFKAIQIAIYFDKSADLQIGLRDERCLTALGIDPV